MAVTSVTTAMAGAINYTVVTDSSADWASVANSTYFYDKTDKLVHYKDSTGTVQEIFSGSGITVGTTPVTSGTDGRVFFQAGGVIQQSANLFWDNSNNRLGIGTSTPTQTLDVSGNSRFQYGTIESGINITGNSGSTTAAIVIGTGTLGTSGALEIWRNGAFALQFFSNIANLGNAYTRLKQGAGLTVTGSGGGSTAANSLTLGSNATDAGVFTAISGTQNTVNIGTSSGDVWSPSSGTATYNLLRINPRINTSGSYNGIVRGVLIDPTLTSSTGVTYRAIETTTGDVIFNSTSGSVAIGSTSPGARLDVRAQGALSTDIAFRVRNSADTRDLFNIRGNRTIEMIADTPSTNGGLNITSDAYNAPIINFYDVFSNMLRIDASNRLIGVTGNANIQIGSFTTIGYLGMVTPSTNNRFLKLVDAFSNEYLSIGGNTYDGGGGISMTLKTTTNNGTNFITFSRNNNTNKFVISDQANVGIGQDTFGTSAKYVLAMANATAPTTSPSDAYQQYSADIVAGNAAPHFRTENGAIVKIYQETTGVGASTLVGGGGTTLTDTDTFDGYTLKQIVKALRNQGLLA